MSNPLAPIQTQFFPISLSWGITAHLMPDRATARAEIDKINRQIFRPDKLRLFEPPLERQPALRSLRELYAHSHPHWIVFFGEENEPIGWFYGYMEDATAFFIDTIGFIPSYRGRGLYTAFLKQLLVYLEASGYERVATTHHPNNRAILIAELKAGFNITGLELHESHGPQVRMVYLVHEDRRRGFEDAFSMVPERSLLGREELGDSEVHRK